MSLYPRLYIGPYLQFNTPDGVWETVEKLSLEDHLWFFSEGGKSFIFSVEIQNKVDFETHVSTHLDLGDMQEELIWFEKEFKSLFTSFDEENIPYTYSYGVITYHS